LLDISMPTFDRMKASGRIGPRPIRLSGGCHRYDLREVLAWIDTRQPDGTLASVDVWPAIWEQVRKKKALMTEFGRGTAPDRHSNQLLRTTHEEQR
jgi:hypothetical protein